jgi:carboxyl-terminal processing protease
MKNKSRISIIKLIIFLSISISIPPCLCSAQGEPLPQQNNSSGTTFLNFLNNKPDNTYNKLFNDVVDRVKTSYVEEVTDKKIYEAAIDGMLSSLDPYSSFLNEKEHQDMMITTKGELSGIGIEFAMDKGFVKVISPYEEGPAFKGGIKIGDIIITINGQTVKGMSLSQAAEKLRGKPKSKLKIGIFRESTNETLEINLVREIIKIIPVKSKLLSENIAYLKISSFNENTSFIIRREYQRLKELAKDVGSEIKGLIIDLRWNAGGLLDQSKEVAELFLEDAIIVSTKGRIPDSNQIYYSTGQDISAGLPIVVLINGGSASASEIVAAALQDNKRALVVGTKSYGKGLIQSVITLPNNTGIKLTTAKFYTPSGKAIQSNGVVPDVVVEEAILTPTDNKPDSQKENITGNSEKERDLAKIVRDKDKLRLFSSSVGEETADFQLLRAIDIVKGMALYSQRLTN